MDRCQREQEVLAPAAVDHPMAEADVDTGGMQAKMLTKACLPARMKEGPWLQAADCSFQAGTRDLQDSLEHWQSYRCTSESWVSEETTALSVLDHPGTNRRQKRWSATADAAVAVELPAFADIEPKHTGLAW